SDLGLAAARVEDFAGAPTHRHAHAKAERLREGLLRGEARGQIAHAASIRMGTPFSKDIELARTEHLLGEALAAALQRALDASDVAHVGADAVDHEPVGAGTAARWIQRR